MTDKYCPLRFREFGSQPHDQRCIGEYCAWYDKCSQSHGEPIYGMPYGNMEPRQVIATEEPQEPREADYNANDEDSREKLDAEVRKWCGMYAYQADMVWVWLNRQAAITERELCKQCEWPSLASQPDQEAYDRIADLQAQLDKLSSDELHWRSEADFWKRKYELICKALIDLNRNYVHVEDEGLA